MIHSYDIFFLLLPVFALIYLILKASPYKSLTIIYVTCILLVLVLSVALYGIGQSEP
jgi:hypothetical protein